MKYLCLVYGEEEEIAAMTDDECSAMNPDNERTNDLVFRPADIRANFEIADCFVSIRPFLPGH